MRRWTHSNGCILTASQLTPGIFLCSSFVCLPSSLSHSPSLCLSLSYSHGLALSVTILPPLSALSPAFLVHSLIRSPFSLPLFSLQLSNSPSLSLSCSLSLILSILFLWCYSLGRQVSSLARQLRCGHYLPVRQGRQSEVSSISCHSRTGDNVILLSVKFCSRLYL